MSASAVMSDFALLIKQSKDIITLKPSDAYKGVELDDRRMDKLYSLYCHLLIEQYNENNDNNDKEQK